MKTITRTSLEDISSFDLPIYSKKKIKKAGEKLVEDSIDYEVLQILNNWRSAHALPLHVISQILNETALSLDKDSLLAKRLKRSPSIINKLKIQENMSLARMQDIGGCRVIVDSIDSVYKTNDKFREQMILNNHEISKFKDYIIEPKKSGYRGLHLVCKFSGENISEKHDGMMVEAQIRTKYQHYWATAVETIGAYLKQSLKSSQGDKDYLKFFSELGDLFAYYEGQPMLEESSNIIDKARLVMGQYDLLRVQDKLVAFSHATQMIEKSSEIQNSGYYLVITDMNLETVRVKPIKKDELKEANTLYTKLENRFRNNSRKDIALVSAKTLVELRDTYPNYFSDTRKFMEHYYNVIKYCFQSKEDSDDKYSEMSFKKDFDELKRRSKKEIRKRLRRNRTLARKRRSLARHLRKISNEKLSKELEIELDLVTKHLNSYCRKTDEIRSYFKRLFSSSLLNNNGR